MASTVGGVRFEDEDKYVEADDGVKIVKVDCTDRGPPLEETNDQSCPNWKEIKTPELTTATIGVALHTGWTHARKEIEFVRDKLEEKCGSRRPKPSAIFDLIFGQSSEIYQVFQSEGIFDNYSSYLQFLGTFFISSSYQVSTKQLFDKCCRINLDGVSMTKELYTSTWQ